MRYLSASALCGGMFLASMANAAPADSPLVALTAEHFRDTATVKDDPLDLTAKIDTLRGYQEKHGLLGVVWNDDFIRIFVDKKSGQTTFQIYTSVMYESARWRFYNSANYETPDGPKATATTKISSDVISCATRSGCTYRESVGFNVDENLLRAYADNTKPGAPDRWLFKLNGQDGSEWKDGLMVTEIRGALMALDRYKARASSTEKNSIFIPAEPFGVDFGTARPIWGLPGGALVASIKRNSIAANSGLKWADAIIEWDGHVVASKVEMADQLAQVSAGKAVPFKVLRGRKTIELRAQF